MQPSPSLPPSPLQQNSQLYEHLEPKFRGLWERKELNHRGPYFLFSSNSWKKGKGSQEMWVVHSIHLGQSTNQQEKRKGTRTFIYMDNQKIFNRRGMIIFFWVKKKEFFSRGISQKKLCYRLQNPEKFIQKSWAILEFRAADNLYCAANLSSAACNISGHFHCISQQKHLILFPHSDNLFIY